MRRLVWLVIVLGVLSCAQLERGGTVHSHQETGGAELAKKGVTVPAAEEEWPFVYKDDLVEWHLSHDKIKLGQVFSMRVVADEGRVSSLMLECGDFFITEQSRVLELTKTKTSVLGQQARDALPFGLGSSPYDYDGSASNFIIMSGAGSTKSSPPVNCIIRIKGTRVVDKHKKEKFSETRKLVLLANPLSASFDSDEFSNGFITASISSAPKLLTSFAKHKGHQSVSFRVCRIVSANNSNYCKEIGSADTGYSYDDLDHGSGGVDKLTIESLQLHYVDEELEDGEKTAQQQKLLPKDKYWLMAAFYGVVKEEGKPHRSLRHVLASTLAVK